MAGIVLVEFDMLKELLFGYLEQGSGNISIEKILIIAGAAVIGLAALFFLMLSKSDNPIFRKIRELVRGIFEGLISIVKMENKGYFLMHTAFIWIMYIGMFWVCFFLFRRNLIGSISRSCGFLCDGKFGDCFCTRWIRCFSIGNNEHTFTIRSFKVRGTSLRLDSLDIPNVDGDSIRRGEYTTFEICKPK